MGNVITTEEDAKAWLALKAQTGVTPSLEDPEIDIILNDNVRLDEWAAGTAYRFGDRVMPTSGSRTGRIYICVAPGTSDSEEPVWSDANVRVKSIVGGELVGNDASSSATIADGDDVRWVDDGAEVDRWSLEDCAHDAWKAKAGKAATMIAENKAGNSYAFDQIYQHCLDMAGRFGGAFIK